MSAPYEIAERALALSEADGCVVLVVESSSVNLRWANNTLTTNGADRDRSVTVISVVGRSAGVRSTSVVDGDALAGLVRASEEAAREAGDAEDYGELVAGAGAADFAEPAEPTSTEVLAAFARDLGEALGAARADGRRLYGFAAHDVTTTWLASSTGLRLRHVQPTGTVEWTAKDDRPGTSVWHGQATRDFRDVSVPETDALLRRRLGWCARWVDLPAGRYETLLPPSAVADLLVYVYWSAAGRDAAEGRTVFSKPGGGTRVGEALGPAGLSMVSDPAEPGLSTSPFAVAGSSSATTSVFDNGLPLHRTAWIEDGRLAALVQTRASAAKTGSPVTPYVDNLILDGGGAASQDDMGAATGRGLLLTCLWYIREVDPQTLLLTGLTRDGVFLVENGEVTGAVNNFRFNESPVDLLARTSEGGRTERTLPREWNDWFTRTAMPTLRVPDFNMSSVSPAS
ncbi:MAG TPA: metallopeptidase TldD-related protein [Frankiaceae bacterium]|nr:metallopeptidase TldD-related protein [Frankiaceae bacterium]